MWTLREQATEIQSSQIHHCLMGLDGIMSSGKIMSKNAKTYLSS